MSNFQQPPTYAEVVLTDERTGKAVFNPVWLTWFLNITQYISNNGGGTSTQLHNSLSGLQGGGTGEYYHLTASEFTALTAGFTGSGNLVRQTGASFTDTPAFGDNTTLVKATNSLTNAAGANTATLTNAPVAGNPTKWVQINDAGVIRRLPLW